MYTQKQTQVYEARPRVTFDYSRYPRDHHWLKHKSQWDLQVWVGRNAHESFGQVYAQVVCPHAATGWRSCTSVLRLARLSFQERKAVRTCATAVHKQYYLALRKTVGVYHSLKSLVALQIRMKHTDWLPRCLSFHEKCVHYCLFRGEGTCIWSSPNPKSSSRKNRYLCEAEYKRSFSCSHLQRGRINWRDCSQDLGSPKGQLRVTEGAGGHGLPARALQVPDSQRQQQARDSWSPDLVCHWWHPSAPLQEQGGIPGCKEATAQRGASVAWAGAAFLHRRLCCRPWWAQSSPAACPLQRAKGSIRAAQRTVESAVWDAQREEPEGLEEKISLIFFLLLFFTP